MFDEVWSQMEEAYRHEVEQEESDARNSAGIAAPTTTKKAKSAATARVVTSDQDDSTGEPQKTTTPEKTSSSRPTKKNAPEPIQEPMDVEERPTTPDPAVGGADEEPRWTAAQGSQPQCQCHVNIHRLTQSGLSAGPPVGGTYTPPTSTTPPVGCKFLRSSVQRGSTSKAQGNPGLLLFPNNSWLPGNAALCQEFSIPMVNCVPPGQDVTPLPKPEESRGRKRHRSDEAKNDPGCDPDPFTPEEKAQLEETIRTQKVTIDLQEKRLIGLTIKLKDIRQSADGYLKDLNERAESLKRVRDSKKDSDDMVRSLQEKLKVTEEKRRVTEQKLTEVLNRNAALVYSTAQSVKEAVHQKEMEIADLQKMVAAAAPGEFGRSHSWQCWILTQLFILPGTPFPVIQEFLRARAQNKPVERPAAWLDLGFPFPQGEEFKEVNPI